MTTEQMIEVMQHHANGGEVVAANRGKLGRWEVLPKQYIYWNWDEYNYRIKQPKKTKTMCFWRVKTKSGWFFSTNMCTEEELKELWPYALDYKRLDMLGSEEVAV